MSKKDLDFWYLLHSYLWSCN